MEAVLEQRVLVSRMRGLRLETRDFSGTVIQKIASEFESRERMLEVGIGMGKLVKGYWEVEMGILSIEVLSS